MFKLLTKDREKVILWDPETTVEINKIQDGQSQIAEEEEDVDDPAEILNESDLSTSISIDEF